MNLRTNIQETDYYDQDEDNAAGICLLTEFQCGATRGNLEEDNAIWLHKSLLPELRDALIDFLKQEKLNPKTLDRRRLE